MHIMVKQDNFKHIVIIGGGIGGLAAALKLSRLSRGFGEKILITVIDKNNYHFFPPGYHRIFSGFKELGRSVSFDETYSSIAIPFAEIFEPHKNIEFFKGETVAMDFEDRKIKTADGNDFYFDYLIISPGSETDFYGNPGIQKYALQMKTPEDVFNIYNSVDELFASKAKKDIIRIVIGGGGFTACGLAAELPAYIESLSKSRGHPLGRAEISIIEGNVTILRSGVGWLKKETEKYLKGAGIKIITGKRIINVSEHEIFFDKGEKMEYDIFLWLAGVKANRLTGIIPGARLRVKGRVQVDEHLRVKNHPNVFVIGDAAYRTDLRTKKLIPMTAYAAADEGKYVAKTITRLIQGDKTDYYAYPGNKFIIPLGDKNAVLDFGWFRISGIPARLIRRFVILRYYLGILSFWKVFKMWQKGLL